MKTGAKRRVGFPGGGRAAAATVAGALLLAPVGGACGSPSAASAAAQKPAPAKGKAAPAAGQQAPTLARALENVAWDAARRGGPLLAVDPQGTALLPGAQLPPGPPPRTGYRLPAVAPCFGRTPVRVGAALTVLAPETMVVLDPSPGADAPDPISVTPRRDRFKLLLASLTPAQWRMLCGARGLGAGDVSRAQAPLFRSLVPLPLRVRRVRTDENGREAASLAARDLGAKERAGVRLRLNWDFTLAMPTENTGGRASLGVFNASLPPNAETLLTGDAPGADPTIRPEDSDRFEGAYLGAERRREMPNRLKPGHLDFAAPALDAPLALAGGRTVGEWVRAAGQAAGLELHADRRVAGLPVAALGADKTGVRAGDLLQALCLAVTGTFRRIDPDDGTGPLYLLTHDTEGDYATRARILQNRGTLDRDGWPEPPRDTAARLRASRGTDYLDFAPEADPPASPALRDAVRRHYAKRAAGEAEADAVTVRLADLSAPMRELVEQRIRRLASAPRPVRVQGSAVTVYTSAKLSFLVPGVEPPLTSFASVPGWDLLPRTLPAKEPPAVLPPLPVPPRPGQGTSAALLVRAETPDDARRAVGEARRRGFAEAWVDAPEDASAAAELLAAAVAAGRRENVRVRAAVSLLRTRLGEDAVPAALRDRGLFDETWRAYQEYEARAHPSAFGPTPLGRRAEIEAGDWLRCDLPEARARVVRRLKAVAAVPGLGGVVLRDTAPNGYAVSGRVENYSTDSPGGGGWSGGYVPALRAALVRTAGIDPVDLYDAPGANLPLPFFPSSALRGRYRETGDVHPGGFPLRERLPEPTPRQAWQALRHAANRALMAECFAALATTGLPVHVAEQTGGRWYAPWTAADAVPNAEYAPTATTARAPAAALLALPIDARFAEPSVPGPVPDGSDVYARIGFLRATAIGWGLTLDELDALTRPGAEPPLAPARYLPNHLRRRAGVDAFVPGGPRADVPGGGVVVDVSRLPSWDDALRLLDAAVVPSAEAAATANAAAPGGRR